MYLFLKCFGRAFLKHGLKAAFDLVPFGGAAYDIAIDGWASYCKETQSGNVQGELTATVQATGEQLGQAASKVVAEIAADCKPEERQRLTQYLEQIPSSIRQSFRRANDPTGRTVPSSLRIETAADLIPLLPTKLPRFREGQKPLTGVDLELVELLGVGGFGEVWKARNPHFDGLPPVALKFCLDPAAKDRLLHYEATVLNQVMRQGKQDGIVALRSAYLSADPPCLEYEYVAGGDLAGLIGKLKRQGKTDPIFAASVVRNLARTVGFMHRLKPPVIHRDLKPANILVQRDNENRLRFKITDFGIGAVAADRELAEHTRRPTSFGEGLTTGLRGAYTPLYASPQQQAGEKPDPRDDVHALGVIWYQLVTADLGLLSIPWDWPAGAKERGLNNEMVQLLGECIASKADGRPADAGVLAERLAKIITQGDGLEKDMKDALEELRTKGDYRAYFKRQGPAHIGVWQAAAEREEPIGQWLLACCLQEGIGGKKQIKAAVGWLKKAAEKGLPAAQNSLGDCYYAGDGVKADSSEAFQLYTKAAGSGLLEAVINVGVCYSEGEGVKQDLAEAARQYRKAAEAGWSRGQNSLGDCYFVGDGVEQDYSQAIAWYRKAAEQGDATGQFNIAYCYDYGRGVKADLGEAARWYRRAAEQEDTDAQLALGYCYEHGRGVGRDIEQAKHWYRKAADQEHRRAVNALDRLLNVKVLPPKPDHDSTKRYWVIAPYGAKPVEEFQQVWQYDLANNIISIGWKSLDDISSLDEQRLRAAIDRTYPDDRPVARGQYFSMLWSFYHKIKVGDVVIARHGVKKLAGVGTVTRTAYFDPIKPLAEVGDWFDFGNHLGIQWHDSPRDMQFDRPVFGLQTVCQIPEERFRALVEKDEAKVTKESKFIGTEEADAIIKSHEDKPL